MNLNRRSLLRFLGLGAAAAVVAPALPPAGAAIAGVVPVPAARTLYVGARGGGKTFAAESYLTSTDAWFLHGNPYPLLPRHNFSKMVEDAVRPMFERIYAERAHEWRAAFAEPAQDVRNTFATIKDALAAANPGDTIECLPGHVETIPAEGIAFDKAVTVTNLRIKFEVPCA